MAADLPEHLKNFESALKCNVSRGTFEALQVYDDLLLKWQKTINLIAKQTVEARWSRHFADSAQLLQICRLRSGLWLDIGSGGGFPGMVCAVLAKDTRPDIKFKLIESDRRKSEFLREVSRRTKTEVEVITDRIEAVPSIEADIISARALANLDTLCEFAHYHMTPHSTCLFQKGANYRDELAIAQRRWQMSIDIYPSITSADAVSLCIRELRHAEQSS